MYQLEHCNIKRKKKKNIKFVKFIFLLPGNGKDFENEFKLQKKKIY